MFIDIVLGITIGFVVGISIILIQDDILRIRKQILKKSKLGGRFAMRIPILNTIFSMVSCCVWHYKSRKLRRPPKISSCFLF